ncbi:N-acetylglucosamine-6-sulfatase-like isoform X1 [Schistocerca serialis cubense]|uniref:N-acetylglucosamine-6-sulfatase-like isoform X1 n=2 Tax=Schistocerca serialis cubense TaxID=2023355 RepID=UPI00214F1ACE|nr:N-acetylglucosamine-6-sulfatase-like isoform X1 [Schistocerca serialis cubense]
MTASTIKFFLQLTVVVAISRCSSESTKPNFVVILTDDQDITIGGMTPMKKTQKLIANEGITFPNAFVTTPICCPSRTSILTGLYQHNHRTVNNSFEGNCFGRKWQNELEPYALPVPLRSLGYKTFYAGKYLNQYGRKEKGTAHVPPGWDWWIGLVGNSRYYNYTLSVNGSRVQHGDQEGDYLTDVITSYSLEFLKQKDVLSSGFFMMLAPPAPHAPFTPAQSYSGYFKHVTAMRTKNFNVPSKHKHWLLRMPPEELPTTTLKTLDTYYHKRWETLLSVDDMVESVVNTLNSMNVLNNTYIIYTSDNGFHIGQFALPWDKRQPYEFDISVPMLVRGPGIPKKKVIYDIVLNIDLAPTIIDIANASPLINMDGKSFKQLLISVNKTNKRGFLVEYVGEGNDETIDPKCHLPVDNDISQCVQAASCKCQDSRNNTYTCLRYMSSAENIIYCQFSDSENYKEAYNLNADPYQLTNLAYNLSSDSESWYVKVLKYLSSCVGLKCNSLMTR